MKNLFSLFLIVLVLISCEKLDEPDILGTYTNVPEGCMPASDLMVGCGRFITLSTGGEADILMGGDVISRTSYKIKGDKIKIEKNDQFGLDLEFKRLNDGSLREEGDKSIWIKQTN